MNRVPPLAFSLVGLALLAGCASLSDRQRDWLIDGQRAYERGQFAHAVDVTSRLLKEAGNQPEAASALYIRAMSHARLEHRTQAYQDLQRCLDLSRDPQLTTRAQVVLGTLFFEDGDWQKAGRLYALAARDRSQPTTPEVLFRLGLCQERTGDWRKARGTFQTLLEAAPNTPFADRAQRRARLNADHFAVQCGVFSRLQNAEALRGRLNEQGISSYIRREPRGEQEMYVVLVGRYPTYASAQRVLQTVRDVVPDAVLWP